MNIEEELRLKALEKEKANELCKAWGMEDNHGYGVKDTFKVGFAQGAKWRAEQSPWIDINDRNIVMPDDKVCLLLLENGVVVIDTEEWEDEYPLSLVTHWMEVPSFDDILKSNKDVLKRIKEKGDK